MRRNQETGIQAHDDHPPLPLGERELHEDGALPRCVQEPAHAREAGRAGRTRTADCRIRGQGHGGVPDRQGKGCGRDHQDHGRHDRMTPGHRCAGMGPFLHGDGVPATSRHGHAGSRKVRRKISEWKS